MPHLAFEQIAPSIGSVGDAYGNASMEAINGPRTSARTALFLDGPYRTIADAESAIVIWVCDGSG